MDKTGILIVNGFDRWGIWGKFNQQEAVSYPWIDVCLRQVERHSKHSNYEIYLYDNSRLEELYKIIKSYPNIRTFPSRVLLNFLGRFEKRFPAQINTIFAKLNIEKWHPKALNFLVKKLNKDIKYLICLDSDAFPIRDGWIETLIEHLENGASIVGVYRNEMAPKITPFIHVSCLCMRKKDFLDNKFSFEQGGGQDVGQIVTLELLKNHKKVIGLPRSNTKNLHFLIGGVYGNLIYHHGAGSRKAKFHTSADLKDDEQIRVDLRNAVFQDLDAFIGELVSCKYEDIISKPISTLEYHL
uniref:Glycosyl transferase family 2 n=1 Tax=Phormidium sp. KS TaxID=654446 RepID=A0A3G9CL58_9CYAN|nr:glycosyl transferase family 2 [Phormidium sp. KS]